MKMLIVIVPRSREKELRAELARLGIRGYTEVPEVLGAGETGAHFGTQAFPGSSTLLFSVLDAAALDNALAGLRAVRARLYEAERLHAFVVPVEKVL
jgi:hypothetical protein